MIFPRRIPGASASVAALLLFALVHPTPAAAIGGPRPVTVTVEGEVRRPGSYTLPHDATLSTLIVAAGGTTDNADLAAATLTRESAKPVAAPLSHPRLLKGSPADLPLADGDTLRIPARTPGAPVRTRARPAGDESFAGPNNFGVTGLFETPTARMMPENRYRLGATQVHPYRYYFGTVGLFDRLEVNGRVTEVIGVKAFTNLPGSGYGNDKDKAVDAKFLVAQGGDVPPRRRRRDLRPARDAPLWLPGDRREQADPSPGRRRLARLRQRPPRHAAASRARGRVQDRAVHRPAQVGARGPPVRRHPVRRDAVALAARGVQPDPLRAPDDRPGAEEIFPDRRPLPVQCRRPRQAAQVAGNRRELAAGKRVRRQRLGRLRHRPHAGPDPRRAVPGTRRGVPRTAPGPDRLRPRGRRLQRHRRFGPTASRCGSTRRTTGTSSRPAPSRCSSPRSPRSSRRTWSTSGCS